MTGFSHNQYQDSANHEQAVDRAIQRHLSSIGTCGLVQVKAVHPGNGIAGTVDIQPLTHQQDSSGDTVPHGIIYGVPYLRIQGGSNAFIVDPIEGDIGYMIVSGRDQTNAIANRAPSAPASFRIHSMADCVYVGGYVNDAPQNFIQISAYGITINTNQPVTIDAGSTTINSNLQVNGNVTATGDVKAGNVSLGNHVHTGVQTGSGTTGGPK